MRLFALYIDPPFKIRATASKDTYYNGIIVPDTYGCQTGGCDEFFLDDGRPGVFKVKVGI
jgi:hypothetical protein